MTRTRIFVVHENPARLKEVALLLKETNHLRVIHGLSSIFECFARISSVNCDIILVSATLPNDGVRTLLKRLRQQALSAKVIVTDVPNDPKQILTYIAAGASGYALVQEGVKAWPKQIDAVCSGKPLVSPSVAAAMIEHLIRLHRLTTRFVPHPRLYTKLTGREHEVLRLLSEGHSNQVIAKDLTITIGTVKNHVHNVLTKLNLNSRKSAGTYLAFVG